MAEKSNNEHKMGILEELYEQPDVFETQDETSRIPLQEKVRAYFKDKERVNQLLSVSILGLGLAGIVLGFFQFRSTLKSYFIPSVPQAITLENDVSADEPDLLGLKNKDTDQDGLSDYDELNLYNTSPYIPDSDSDGVGDAQEIARNSDPNCPAGEDCFDLFGDGLGADGASGDELSSLLGQSGVSLYELRQALLDTGVTEAQLAEFSDDELLRVYDYVLREESLPADQQQTVIIPDDNLSNLSSSQLRSLLRSAGVSEEILGAISDEELLELAQSVVVSE